MRRDVTLRCVVPRVRPAGVRFVAAVAAVWIASCADKTIEAYPDELVGIGVVVKANAGGFVIGSVVDGGPAAEAGLKGGDRLVEVNGKSTDGQSLANVVDSLRGHDGSDVVVRVARAESSEVLTLKRRRLARAAGGYQARE